jgi:AbrB family looped-hinge helix DNA binding protein
VAGHNNHWSPSGHRVITGYRHLLDTNTGKLIAKLPYKCVPGALFGEDGCGDYWSVWMKGMSARIADGGRLVIPAEYRHALGLETGDEVIIRLEDGELRILTRAEAVKRAQAIVRRHVKEGRSLVDELTTERHATTINKETGIVAGRSKLPRPRGRAT